MTPRTREPPRTFTSSTPLQLAEVCGATGAKRSQVEYWVRRGVIVPDVLAAEGAGNYRFFSPLNLVEFALAVRLNRLRSSVELIARAVLRFREFHLTAVALCRHATPEQTEWASARELRNAVSAGAQPNPERFRGRATFFTAEQRIAFNEAFADACLRRDAFARTATKDTSSRSYARRSRDYYLARVAARYISEGDQAAMLIQALNWRTFCRNQESRRAASEAGAFFGVFVFEEGEHDAQIVDENSGLRELVIDAAAVVSFERLLNLLENKLDAWGLLDNLFR